MHKCLIRVESLSKFSFHLIWVWGFVSSWYALIKILCFSARIIVWPVCLILSYSIRCTRVCQRSCATFQHKECVSALEYHWKNSEGLTAKYTWVKTMVYYGLNHAQQSVIIVAWIHFHWLFDLSSQEMWVLGPLHDRQICYIYAHCKKCLYFHNFKSFGKLLEWPDFHMESS